MGLLWSRSGVDVCKLGSLLVDFCGWVFCGVGLESMSVSWGRSWWISVDGSSVESVWSRCL
jgi:hypothetical protein